MGALLIPLLGYWAFFSSKRFLLPLLFSDRVNIVIAYNLSGAAKSFIGRYNLFINNLENKLREENLEKYIKIVKAPSDITFTGHAAAEAKTKLSLKGSTLVIWGHPENTRRGVVSLKTLFSYEFGYPTGSDEDLAKQSFAKNIRRGLEKFQFEIQDDVLDYYIAVSLLVLGNTAASFGLLKESERLFEEFIELFRKSNFKTQFIMAPAYGVVEENLKQIKLGLCEESFWANDYESMKNYAESVIKLDKNNYFANIQMAIYWELTGDRAKARQFNDIAYLHNTQRMHNHLFSDAYLALADGKYDEAIKKYKLIPPKTSINVEQVRAFLYDRYKKTNDPAFLFAEGLVTSKWHTDTGDAKQTLEEFLNIVRTPTVASKYEVLKSEAQELLKSISES
ncbi:MAG: hypothetical protein HYW37_00390 [Candidatus Colwellbacteria bacterium]|nr:hypothetical protein [Candidatus Colwellbacteria bacterium]